jgi:site-specific recombinase XerD
MITRLSNHYQLSPDIISTDQFKDFAYMLVSEHQVSTSTVNQLISAWKILQTDVLCRKWEPFRIKRPKRAKLIPRVLSQEEALALIDAPENLKHRSILTVCYVTGMRCSEVINLKVADIDSGRRVIRVLHGKGKKQREVQLPDKLLAMLREYYLKFRPDKYLFAGFKPGTPYSATSIRKIINRGALQAGITKNVSPHVLRHSYATHMLENGVDIRRLQMLMGHNSIKTTTVYLHLANITDANLPNLLDGQKVM